MEPKAPENPNDKNIVKLTNEFTDVLWPESLSIMGDNIGASKWSQMLEGMNKDGKERGLDIYYNLLTKNFSSGEIYTGDESSISLHQDLLKPSVLIKSPIRRRVVNVHSHPLGEDDLAKTVLPSGNDIRALLTSPELSAIVIIGKGGVHLVLRTYHNLAGKLPDPKFIQGKIDEVEKSTGLVADVQKQLNRMFSPYGLSYFYAENIDDTSSGIIKFKKP